MTSYGYFLASEDHGPRALVEQAQAAEAAGFRSLWISDHYHPWLEAQGHSPFVWTTIGALAQATALPVATAVTCPSVRVHPAVIAQAAATSGALLQGRFRLGVGTGEALNEHILGDAWPEASVRLEMLEEAVEVIRALFTGKRISHRGRHYTVENARLYTLPDEPVPIDVSGYAPAATELAARIGDGFVTMGPEGDLLRRFRSAGGEGRPTGCAIKVCYDTDRGRAARTVLERWPNLFLPGELAALLPEPKHFEQATQLVTEQQIAGGSMPLGDDPEEHIRALAECRDAGFDEVYVSQIGPDMDGFFEFYRTRVLPALD
ncbi:TIGR03557 family F420-dependent LLM class oxidoreductase [Streptomyces sp. NPDC059853]|uniref:TIGR03557 family F420-dependent LLM class oxidoreductase n=1 Tax=Streptomyces sp. NPDC059853 TaxID=3346973 RepID=UPI0036524A8F